MSDVVVATPDALRAIIDEAVGDALKRTLPPLIQAATKKEYLTGKEVEELTGWSRRTLFYLRKQKRIPFTMEGRRILYPREGLLDYLKSNQIEARIH